MDAMIFVLLVFIQLGEFSDAFPLPAIGRSSLSLYETTSLNKGSFAFDQATEETVSVVESNEGKAHSSSWNKFYDNLNTSDKSEDGNEPSMKAIQKLPRNWQALADYLNGSKENNSPAEDQEVIQKLPKNWRAMRDYLNGSNENDASGSEETVNRELPTVLLPRNFRYASIRAREPRKVSRTWQALDRSKGMFINKFPAIVPAMPSKFPKRSDFIVNMSKAVVSEKIETAIALARRVIEIEKPNTVSMSRVDAFSASRTGFEQSEESAPIQSMKTELLESGSIEDNASHNDIADSLENPLLIPYGTSAVILAVMEDVVNDSLIPESRDDEAATDPIGETAGTIDGDLPFVEDVVRASLVPESSDGDISKPVTGATTDPIVENAGTSDLAVIEDAVHDSLIPESSDDDILKPVTGATTNPMVENAGTIDVGLAVVEDVVHDSLVPESNDDDISKPVTGATTDPIVENAGTIDASLAVMEDVVHVSLVPSDDEISRPGTGATSVPIGENVSTFVEDVVPLGTDNTMAGILVDSDVNSSPIVGEAKESVADATPEAAANTLPDADSVVQESDAVSILEYVPQPAPFFCAPANQWAGEMVHARLMSVAQKKAEQERKAREEADRLAEEARLAQEALAKVAAEIVSAGNIRYRLSSGDAKDDDAAKWADDRVHERVEAQARRKAKRLLALESIRRDREFRVTEANRLMAEADLAQRDAERKREQWAGERVRARVRAQAERKRISKQQRFTLGRKNRAMATGKLSEAENSVKVEAAEGSRWASERVESWLMAKTESFSEPEA